VQCLGADALRTKGQKLYFYDSGVLVDPICAFFTDVRETHKLIIAHINSTRKIKGLENSTAVLVLESNLAYVCTLYIYEGNFHRTWIVVSDLSANISCTHLNEITYVAGFLCPKVLVEVLDG
jgi:hypothetical protein